jgi:hypothetical protein
MAPPLIVLSVFKDGEVDVWILLAKRLESFIVATVTRDKDAARAVNEVRSPERLVLSHAAREMAGRQTAEGDGIVDGNAVLPVEVVNPLWVVAPVFKVLADAKGA